MSTEFPYFEASDSAPKKTRKACQTCRSRKTKCSGSWPTCSLCIKLGTECVYQPYEKKISMLKSTYSDMEKKIRELEAELATVKAETKGPISNISPNSENRVVSNNTLLNSGDSAKPVGSNLESGSSDLIIMKFAKMRNIDVSPKESSSRDDKMPKNKLSPLGGSVTTASTETSKTGSTVFQTLYNLNLQDALDLIDESHFYLSDLYCPYSVELINSKLRSWYSSRNGFTFLYLNLKQSKTDSNSTNLLEPLILIALALGMQYKGFVHSTTEEVLLFALKYIPFTKIKEVKQNYLAVSAMCIASLFYRAVGRDDDAIMFSNLSMQFINHLRLNSYDVNNGDSQYDLEFKSRATWVAFGLNRILSAKLGGAVLLRLNDIDRPLPTMKSFDENDNLLERHEGALTSLEFTLYIELTSVAEEIYGVIYSKDLTTHLSSTFGDVVQRLINWNSGLPDRLKLNAEFESRRHKRFVYSLHLLYCFCIHLTTIPIMYNLVEKQKTNQEEKITQNIFELLTICINAAQLTLNMLVNCINDNMLAIFGMMDVDYIYSSGLTFFICGDVLSIDSEYCKKALDSCLMILNRMINYGNVSVVVKFERLAGLIEGYRSQQLEATKDKHRSVTPCLPTPTQHNSPTTGEPENFVESRFNNFDFENNSLDSILELSTDVVGLFQSLTNRDLNIWEDGYRTWNQTDQDWEAFQRSLFEQRNT